MADDLSAGFANLIDRADQAEAFDKKRDEIKGKSALMKSRVSSLDIFSK